MTLAEHALRLVAAIRRATEEHGAPNTFSFGELHVHYNGPSPMLAGRAAREWIRIDGVTFEPGLVRVEREFS